MFVCFFKNLLSNNDRANLLNDLFVLAYNEQDNVYEQAMRFIRTLFDQTDETLLPWSVFIWHWNYIFELEEHSGYFWNYKV